MNGSNRAATAVRPPAWQSWGQVLRLSLTASALADVACGVLVGRGGWPAGAGPFLALAGSAAVYHGGMALNDWSDRAEDARARPERPIPSGRLSAGAVLGAALALLVAGPLVTGAVDARAGAVLAAVAVLAALYDVAGRGAVRGPLLLGLCRFGNLTAGLLVGAGAAGRDLEARALLLPAVYALYVFVLSVLGRREDDLEREPGRLPATVLHLASLCLLAAPVAGAWATDAIDPLSPHLAGGLALAIWAVLGLQRAAAREGDWSRTEVPPVMGLLLRRLLIVTASAALASAAPGSTVVAAAILAGYLVSHRLRRIFPPS